MTCCKQIIQTNAHFYTHVFCGYANAVQWQVERKSLTNINQRAQISRQFIMRDSTPQLQLHPPGKYIKGIGFRQNSTYRSGFWHKFCIISFVILGGKQQNPVAVFSTSCALNEAKIIHFLRKLRYCFRIWNGNVLCVELGRQLRNKMLAKLPIFQLYKIYKVLQFFFFF